MVVSASCGVEPGRIVAYKPLLDEAIEIAAHKPESCIILQRPIASRAIARGPRPSIGRELVADAKSQGQCRVRRGAGDRPALHPLHLGHAPAQPKGVVRDNGGHMVALEWSMKNLYGVEPGEVFWAASDIGWVVGHSYIVYAPLLHGMRTVLYEGKPVGTPDAGAFWRVIKRAQSRVPLHRADRAPRHQEGGSARRHSSELRPFCACARCSWPESAPTPTTMNWAEEHLKVPVIDHWWQTETGWAIAGNPVGLGGSRSSAARRPCRCPAMTCAVLDDGGPSGRRPVTLGNIVIKLPLPPGCLPTLWNADARFGASYLADFPGYYKTADAGYCDADGYLFVMGRTDDVINVAGHRLSTGAMEEVLASHKDVAECAVIGAADALKGEVPIGFLVLKAGVDREVAAIEKEVVDLVRDRIGPVAAFKIAVTVARLPKTRSGKILRGTMKKIVDGASFNMPATIDDPVILDEIGAALLARRDAAPTS